MFEQASGRVSLEEYLRFEETSPVGHEYRNGYIVGLAEPSGNHQQIQQNLVLQFGSLLKRSRCRMLSGGVKVACPNGERVIPDFGVTGRPDDLLALERAGEALIEHPWLVIEILSPATEKDDRGDKLDSYNLIRDLTHYVLIDSRRRWMLVHERTADGLLAISGPLERFTLPILGELTSDIVYDGTTVARIG